MKRKKLPASKQQLLNSLVGRVESRESKNEIISSFASTLSPKQRAFFVDPSLNKVCLAGRQSGKTHVAIGLLVTTALARENSLCIFIATTKQQAREIIWDRLKLFCFNYGVEHTPHEVDAQIRFANGSKILILSGESDVIEKYRGLTKCTLCIVDETASFSDGVIQRLVVQIIKPLLRGPLVMLGTPGIVQRGYFYDRTTQPSKYGFNAHYFDVRDNPYEKDPEAYLRQRREENGWSESNPTYVREYLGKWVLDTDAACYKFDPAKNQYSHLPGNFSDYTFVLGLDVGYSSASAFVVVGWRAGDKTLYVVDSDSVSQLSPTEFCQKVAEYHQRYKPMATVIDPGGGGAAYSAELKRQHSIGAITAKKQDKAIFIQFVNSELHEGRVKIRADLPIIPEMENLVWDPKAINQLEKKGVPNHQTDAFSYAFRYALNHLQGAAAFQPKFNTPEYWQLEEERMWKAAREQDQKSEAEELELPRWQRELF